MATETTLITSYEALAVSAPFREARPTYHRDGSSDWLVQVRVDGFARTLHFPNRAAAQDFRDLEPDEIVALALG